MQSKSFKKLWVLQALTINHYHQHKEMKKIPQETNDKKKLYVYNSAIMCLFTRRVVRLSC